MIPRVSVVRRALPSTVLRLTGRPLLAASALFAVGLMATATAPFTWWVRVGCVVGGVMVTASALRHGWLRRGHIPSPIRLDRRSLTLLSVWLVLLAGFAGFQLGMFSLHPREDYPTWSHLTNIAFGHRVVRAAGFAGWIAMGIYLVKS
jgi:hypothetical protein